MRISLAVLLRSLQ